MEDVINKTAEELLLSPDLGIAYIKHSQHGVIAINEKAEIVLVNPSAELMFGYHKSELLGKTIEILLPDNLKEKHKGHRDGFISHPRNRPMGISLALRGRRKNGEEITVEINLIPVSTVEGLITIAEVSRK